MLPRAPDGLAGARRMPALVRLLRAQRPAIVHAHLTWPLAMKWTLAAALAARVPAVVASVQLYLPFHTNRWILWQQAQIARRMGRYIAVSDAVRAACLRTCDWPAERVTVVHNGIDPASVQPETALAAARPSAGGRRAGRAHPARLDPQKGLSTASS